MDGIPVGAVIHMYSRVASKEKIHVVCCVDPKPLAFFINSELNDFVQNRQELVACNVQIKLADYPGFLKHDSYIACCEPVSIVGIDDEAHQIVGNINRETLDAMREAVDKSPILVQRQKDWILEAIG